MEKELSQTKDVLDYLKIFGSITSIQAIKLFSATRLSAIIYNLRAKGYNIETVMVEATNRYGHTSRYAEYYLMENKDEQK